MSIIQESGLLDISKMELAKQVEDGFNQQLEQEIIASIEKAQQEFKSDIFGFGQNVHAQHPQKWREIEENWDDYFSEASISVTVESSADRSGQLKKPFKIKG
jgi:spore germination protein KC